MSPGWRCARWMLVGHGGLVHDWLLPPVKAGKRCMLAVFNVQCAGVGLLSFDCHILLHTSWRAGQLGLVQELWPSTADNIARHSVGCDLSTENPFCSVPLPSFNQFVLQDFYG